VLFFFFFFFFCDQGITENPASRAAARV